MFKVNHEIIGNGMCVYIWHIYIYQTSNGQENVGTYSLVL
jgi:hypothetical protein